LAFGGSLAAIFFTTFTGTSSKFVAGFLDGAVFFMQQQ
jgi:hypothetical protein